MLNTFCMPTLMHGYAQMHERETEREQRSEERLSWICARECYNNAI